MRNPSQALLLAVLMASLILPPGLPVAGATVSGPASPAKTRSILLVGDSLSIGLGKQLDAVFAGRPGVRFAHLGKVSSGLANPAFFNWDEQLTAQVKAHHPDLVLIMVGANDDKPLPALGGGQAAFGTKAWDAAYAARLAKLHAIVRAENPQAAVAYIGVPVMGDPAFNALMLHVNGVIEKTARSLPGASYIDVEHTLADASGAYAPVARTADGNVVKLRAEDGVHISGTGSRLLAVRCLEAVADATSLPQRELLAAVDGRDAVPLASAAAPVRLAEAKSPAAKAAPAKVEIAKNDAIKPAPVKAEPVKAEPAKAAPVAVVAAKSPAAPAAPVVAKAPAAPAASEVAKAAPVAAPAAGTYQVADGDTLWSVAKRVGVSADALVAANPGIDARRMSIGQSLALPAGATLAAADKAPAARSEQPDRPARPEQAGRAASVHVVAEGDNFWNVARRYDVTVAALTAVNPSADPTRLRIGQELAVPDAAAAQASVMAAAPAVEASEQRYVVADGDNLWSIARRLGIDVDRLTQANRTVDPLRLRPGQVLSLPGVARADRDRPAPVRKAEEGAVLGDAGLYPVAKGDTLWALSRRFGVDLETLLSVNGEVDPSHMHVGQLVTIPGGGPMASAEALVFPVGAGDTLWSIARRFDISVEALAAANPGVDPLRLREGQTLRVPSSLAAVAASASPKDEPRKAPAAVPTAARPAEAPVAAPAALDAAARMHTVSEGDTVWDLARRYGVSVAGILAENAGLNPVRLHVGQLVRVPGGAVAMAAR
jgi:LysM repeat protein